MTGVTVAGHTPGPWESSFDARESGHVIRMGEAIETPWSFPSEQIIRYEHSLYPTDPDDADQFALAEANARLIAAAPDLLTACKSAQEYLSGAMGEGAREVFAELTAAIARATGEASHG